MDPLLLRLYSEELAHLREVGAEFAQEFPKIASRLGMETLEVSDPYVERLLEGFAFLAARVQLKLEAEQPRLIAHLLESIYPNFLAPTPSMMVVRFGADLTDPNLARGFTLPRGSVVQSTLPRGQNTECEFRTSQSVTVWPIEIVAVQYFSYAPDLPFARVPAAQGAKGGLRVRLRCGGGLQIASLGIDSLCFYISAPGDTAFRLHELVLGTAVGSWTQHAGSSSSSWRDGSSIRSCGYGDDEALLPESTRAFSGHRLVQELATLPQRFLFFEVADLAERLAGVEDDSVELVLLFSRGEAALEAMVDTQCLSLNCTPAINLFPKRLDRVALGLGSSEYHLVADRTKPMDFEVHSVETVIGHGAGQDSQRAFRPLYDTRHGQSGSDHGYFALRRDARLPSERQRLQGARSAYIGEEVFMSLVDADHGPYRQELRQLSVSALVTNRDLPTLLPAGSGASPGTSIWQLESPGPISRVDALRGPTRPASRQPRGTVGWNLISQLSMNHLALCGESPEEASAGMRTMLRLYGPIDDVAWTRQVDGLRAMSAVPVVRRLPVKGPLSFGNGISIDLELDELAFQGASAFLLASVLERFLARHAAINSFTQLTLRSTQRGLVHRWPPRMGGRERL